MIKNKVWIVGADGRLGMSLQKLMDPMEYEILRTDIDAVDLTKTEEVITFAKRNRPDIIINCAGFTNVAKCEEDPDAAYRVNVLGERNISVAANMVDAKQIFISTKMVYPANAEKEVTEFDALAPQNTFAKTKAAAEELVKSLTNEYFIIRTGWMYGKKNDFVNHLVGLSKTRKSIALSDEVYGSPTSAKEVAEFIVRIMDSHEYGTYNVACEGRCSVYEFAQEVKRLLHLDVELVKAKPGEEELTEYYPADVRSRSMMMELSGMEPLLAWEEALKRYVTDNF